MAAMREPSGKNQQHALLGKARKELNSPVPAANVSSEVLQTSLQMLVELLPGKDYRKMAFHCYGCSFRGSAAARPDKGKRSIARLRTLVTRPPPTEIGIQNFGVSAI